MIIRNHTTKAQNSFKDKGDALRDSGNFRAAAEAYSAHLKINTLDLAIWIQLGHMLKDSGEYDKARDAYNSAMKINNNNYDLYLNIGHLEKMAGQIKAAQLAYETALNLNPNCRDAVLELVAMGATLPKGKDNLIAQEKKTLYLDMTDLMEYVKHNPSLSGIQRVVANLIRYSSTYSSRHDVNIVLVIPEYDNKKIFSVNPLIVMTMLDVLQNKDRGREEINKLIDAIYSSRKIVFPKNGDFFTIAGAFWIYPHYDMIRDLKVHGIVFVIFIHDLIQISHPQYVHHEATLTFRRALVESLGIADTVLTNSEFVAEDVRDFIKTKSDVNVPVKAVTLSTELANLGEGAQHISQDVIEILREPYVLSVSTIEVRKNHMYMIRVWEGLISSGVNNIPNLVFVGKIGWDIDAFNNYLETSDQLEGRLKLLHGISDHELSILYRHAKFTMFASFVEGFGLPVGESLAYGVPCVSSNQSSMPEVGGAFARYLDPNDVQSGIGMVRNLIENPQELENWREDIRSNYKAKSWESFAFEYFDEVLKCAPRHQNTAYNYVYSPGEVYGFGHADLQARDDFGKRLTYLSHARHRGWHETEEWGCWAANRRAILQVRTSLGEETKTRIFLEAVLPSDTVPEGVHVKVECGGISTIIRGFAGVARWQSALGIVGPDGILEIVLTSIGRFAKPDDRSLFIGVKRLAFCRADDIGTRMDILEAITFGD